MRVAICGLFWSLIFSSSSLFADETRKIKLEPYQPTKARYVDHKEQGLLEVSGRWVEGTITGKYNRQTGAFANEGYRFEAMGGEQVPPAPQDNRQENTEPIVVHLGQLPQGPAPANAANVPAVDDGLGFKEGFQDGFNSAASGGGGMPTSNNTLYRDGYRHGRKAYWKVQERVDTRKIHREFERNALTRAMHSLGAHETINRNLAENEARIANEKIDLQDEADERMARDRFYRTGQRTEVGPTSPRMTGYVPRQRMKMPLPIDGPSVEKNGSSSDPQVEGRFDGFVLGYGSKSGLQMPTSNDPAYTRAYLRGFYEGAEKYSQDEQEYHSIQLAAIEQALEQARKASNVQTRQSIEVSAQAISQQVQRERAREKSRGRDAPFVVYPQK